jgi:uncharacterized protein
MGNPMVDDLLTLQEMDAGIANVHKELRSLESELEELDLKRVELERREREASARLEAHDAAVRAAERTVSAGRATLKRLQQRALEIHNMREHAASRLEVEAARQNLDQAETNMLLAMQEQERARAELNAAATEVTGSRAVGGERRREIEARHAELSERLAIERDRRENKALRLDDSVRTLYDRVRGGRTSRALAPVLDGVCGSCFTSIPLQRQAEIRAGRALFVCEACGVILHAER